MNFQIKSVYFRLDHFTPFCIKVLLGKRTVFQSRRTYPNLHTILAFLSNEFFIMNFVFWQDRSVELSLAPNQKTGDCHAQMAIAEWIFNTLARNQWSWSWIDWWGLLRKSVPEGKNYTSGIHCVIFDRSSYSWRWMKCARTRGMKQKWYGGHDRNP